MTLRDNVHQLIRPHASRRPDGKIATRDALLDQLAEAISPGLRVGGTGQGDSYVPIAVNALDTWRDIDKTLREEEQKRSGSMKGTPGSILARWETEVNPTMVTRLTEVTGDIVDDITDLIDPTPKRRALRKPCPACRTTWTHKGDGDRTSALTAGTHDPDGTMRQPRDYDVACAACGAEWRGQQLTWVLQVISDTRASEVTTPM